MAIAVVTPEMSINSRTRAKAGAIASEDLPSDETVSDILSVAGSDFWTI
jgi:hypothetical protein